MPKTDQNRLISDTMTFDLANNMRQFHIWRKLVKTVKGFSRVTIVSIMVGVALVVAVAGLGIAEIPLFAQLYIQGNTVADIYDASVPAAWFHLAQQLARETPGYSPPVASRTFGYMGIALYEAIVPGMPGYQSLFGQINGLPALNVSKPGEHRHWPTVANAALAEIVRNLFPNMAPENLAAVDLLEEQFVADYRFFIRTDVVAQSISHGKDVAKKIYEWSKEDGGHQAFMRNQPETYMPPTGPGLWEPTPPRFGLALQPTWGSNRPFVLKSGKSCAPNAPPRYSTDRASQMYQEGMEVYNTVKNLSTEQREIALFWADNPVETGTPSGHSIAITTQVLQGEDASLALAAITYAKVGMAVADAFIGCWDTKYTYNRVRPITYIQKVIDPTWNTPDITDPVRTPPFPAYTSGHAVETSAVMTVLSDLFGAEYSFTDRTHVDRGFSPRTYPSFVAAAEEAALSRLYGGIHYRSDNEAGLLQGACIGEQINALVLKRE